MGRRLKGNPIWSGKVKASDFNRDFYDDKRGDYNGDGRSHNILTDLVISIDGRELKTDKSEKSVSGMVSTFSAEIRNLDSDIGDKIDGEIAKNLVRIDLVYNICCIINDSDWKDQIEFSFKVYGQKKENANDNNIDDESVSLNDHYFYRMIKHWIVSDHYNPTIRSEMIWDMLLSDFICDMMRKKYDEKGEGKEIIMLAKEFPYSNSEKLYRNQEINLQGPKVDYLVGVGDILYFVELKTDLGSFAESQCNNYRKYVDGSESGFSVDDLWDRYKRIVKKAGSGKNYFEYTSTEKYRYQLDKMKKACNMEDIEDEAFIDQLKNKYKEIKLTYITFDTISELTDDEQIILRNVKDDKDDNLQVFKPENEDDDIKRQRWFLVKEIINEVMRGEMPKPIEPE